MKSVKLMNPRAKPGEAYIPTDWEHIANIISHVIFIIPSIFATRRMVKLSDSLAELNVALLYGFATVLLFCTSSLFHFLSFTRWNKKLEDLLHYADRAVIYFFMASCYTPWLVLRHFDQNFGMIFMWLTWAGAFIGMTYQYVFFERHKTFETFLYIIIGAIPAAAWFYMVDLAGTVEMIVGGMTYMIGVVFFKADGKIPFAHAIWHFFVLVGAAIHFYAVERHLIN